MTHRWAWLRTTCSNAPHDAAAGALTIVLHQDVHYAVITAAACCGPCAKGCAARWRSATRGSRSSPRRTSHDTGPIPLHNPRRTGDEEIHQLARRSGGREPAGPRAWPTTSCCAERDPLSSPAHAQAGRGGADLRRRLGPRAAAHRLRRAAACSMRPARARCSLRPRPTRCSPRHSRQAGRGVLFIVKNYAGDAMNFQMASDMLRHASA